MTHFRTIEIDFDVHRCIENERRGFDESPNDALRRLLKLEEQKSSIAEASGASSTRKNWSGQGVNLPHGTPIRMCYDHRIYEGQIVDGKWKIGDKTFNSPSDAASGIAITRKGKTTRLNGWDYWEVKLSEKHGWTSLESLRPSILHNINLAGLSDISEDDIAE